MSFNCGGSLISENYVLSAAHCEKSDEISPSFVRLGDQNLKTKTDNANETDINIVKFIKHPQHSYRLSKNDIALIKLEYSVTYKSYLNYLMHIFENLNLLFFSILALQNTYVQHVFGNRVFLILLKLLLQVRPKNKKILLSY